MDKNKIIPILISASTVSFFAVGCTNIFDGNSMIYNESKTLDIGKAEDDDSYDKIRYTYNENEDYVNKYDQLDIVSYTSELNNETLDYDILLILKNSSKKTLKNVEININATNSETGMSVNNSTFETIAPNQEVNLNITVSKDDMLRLANSNEHETASETKRIIEGIIRDKAFYLKYNYTYDTIKNKNLYIEHELDFDGNLFNRCIYSTTPIDTELKSTHRDNGSYFNLIKPEQKYDNNLLETQNIELKIDKDFNFEIKAKFKNISKDTIDAFRFEPYIILGDTYAPDSLNRQIKVKESIKPGEVFEVSATYSKDVVKECVQFVSEKAIRPSMLKDEDKALKHLVEKRLLALNYTYDYETKDKSIFVTSTFSRSGKLDIMKIYEYKLNN